MKENLSLRTSDLAFIIEKLIYYKIKGITKSNSEDSQIYDIFIPLIGETSERFISQFNHVLSGYELVDINSIKFLNKEDKEKFNNFISTVLDNNSPFGHLRELYIPKDLNEEEVSEFMLFETLIKAFETYIGDNIFEAVYDVYKNYDIKPEVIESTSLIFIGPSRLHKDSVPGVGIIWTPRNKVFIDNLIEISKELKKTNDTNNMKINIVKAFINDNKEIIKDLIYIQFLFNNISKLTKDIFDINPIDFVYTYSYGSIIGG